MEFDELQCELRRLSNAFRLYAAESDPLYSEKELCWQIARLSGDVRQQNQILADRLWTIFWNSRCAGKDLTALALALLQTVLIYEHNKGA